MVPLKSFFTKLATDEAGLEKLAAHLGVSMFGTAVTAAGHTGTDTYEVQRRIREAIADARNSWLWLLALLSAVTSVLSALAAWRAVFIRGLE